MTHDAGPDGGSYALLLALEENVTLTVGRLGERTFRRGHYAYVGTAFGPGGLARVERHGRVADGENRTRHWHIDDLLPRARLEAAYTVQDERIECSVADDLPGRRIEGFGSSDCDCPGHLVRGRRDALREALRAWYGPPEDAR